MFQDSYRWSSTTWSARKRFQEDHEYLCKTRHFIVVIQQHLLLQMLQTAAAQEDGAPCCIYKLCRCNYRHYSKTNQMLEFHQNQSRNSLYLTAWYYLSDKIATKGQTAETWCRSSFQWLEIWECKTQQPDWSHCSFSRIQNYKLHI